MVLDEFKQLYEMAERICGALLDGSGMAFDLDAMMWFAAAALSVNYRVSAPELSALELLAPARDVVLEIAHIAVDGETWLTLMGESEKKTNVLTPVGSA